MGDSVDIWNSLYTQDAYTAIAPYTEVIAFLARAFQRNGGGKKLLEIGCGVGQNLAFARWAMGFDVYGVDYSEKAIMRAKRIFEQRSLEYAVLVAGDASRMKYPGEFFDVIVDRAALQHNSYERIETIVAKMYRTLKKGGLICCSLAAEDHCLFGRGDYLGHGDFFDRGNEGMRHFFSRRDILELFSGFEILRWQQHTREDVCGNSIIGRTYHIEARKK